MYCEVLALEGLLKPSLTKVFAKFWTEDLPHSDISQISHRNLIVKISLHFYAFWLNFVIIFIFTFEEYSESQECGYDENVTSYNVITTLKLSYLIEQPKGYLFNLNICVFRERKPKGEGEGNSIAPLYHVGRFTLLVRPRVKPKYKREICQLLHTLYEVHVKISSSFSESSSD